MAARLDYGWRFVATAFGFALFGTCGLLFSLVVFPLASAWPHRASRQRAVTTVIHRFFRLFLAGLQRAGVMELDVAGANALRSGGPAIIVANHPTYLDVVVLLALTPSACCVVKNAHWRNPCLGGILRAAQYVSNADPAAFVQDCAHQLANGYSVIIFPEGSRSPAPNRLHAFSRGFAHTALEADVPILPVLMHCDPPVFTRQMRWYHIPERPFRMTANVLAPIGVQPLAPRGVPPALAARSVTRAIEAQITQYLFDYGYFKTGN
jgi:1-acyl-sn-glycerol-3-phosphate acyltransferase